MWKYITGFVLAAFLGIGAGWTTLETAEAQYGYQITAEQIEEGLSGGQLLLPDGTAASPAASFTNDPDTGLYSIGANNLGISVGGALVMDWEDTNAAGAGADLVTISSTLGIMDGGSDIVRGMYVNLVNVNHTGGNVYGIDIADLGGTGPDANATETAININGDWDTQIAFDGNPSRQIDFLDTTSAIRFANTGTLQFFDAGGDVEVWIRDPHTAATDYDVFELDVLFEEMDGSDTLSALFIDITNVNHTGASNVLYGINIDGITADDDATETGIVIGDGWDRGIEIGTSDTSSIFLSGDDHHIRYSTSDNLTFGDSGEGVAVVLDLQTFPNSTVDFADTFMVGVGDGTDTIAVMDGSDSYSMLRVGFVNANHSGSGNSLYGMEVLGITGDPDAYESALSLGGGFDTHIHFTETGATPPDNPPAGTVAMFMDDNADYSGGGGNDCIIGAIDSAGNITIMATITANGACP